MKAKYCPCRSVKLFADIVTQSIHLRLSRRRGKMNIRYRVELSEAERSELGSLLRGGQHAARKLKRAQILLAADAGVPDETIAQSLGVGGSTVYRTKRHFVEGTLGEALHEEPRPGAKRKLFWSRPRAPARPRAALAGPSNCSPARWCASPSTIASRAKPCAGAWPRTSSSPGARRCGACRRSTASTSRAWRTCSICTPNPSTRRAQWCASTRALFN